MADLTVTISEGVNIDGVQRGGSITTTIADIMDVYDRVITVPTSTAVQLYSTHASNVAGDIFDADFVKYVRITNKDSVNYLTITITGASGDIFYYKLSAGRTLVLWDHKTVMDTTRTCEGEWDYALADLSGVTATANTAEIRTEIFVASKNA